MTYFKRPDYATQSEFRRLLQRPFHPYWHNLFGFDVVKLGDDLQTPDDISTTEHINSLYGQEAVELVNRVLQSELVS